MASIEDHEYLKICAQLATCLSISLASARKKVEFVAAKEGVKDLPSRRSIAERLLQKALSQKASDEGWKAAEFDQLLEALAEDDNFMVED